jgi:hypothetical protein
MDLDQTMEEEILEALEKLIADGFLGSYFDEESGEMMYYAKEKLH